MQQKIKEKEKSSVCVEKVGRDTVTSHDYAYHKLFPSNKFWPSCCKSDSSSAQFFIDPSAVQRPQEKHKSNDNYEKAKEKGKDTFEVGKGTDKAGKVKNDATHQKADKKLKESKDKAGKKDKNNLQGAGES
uniref:Uncharacterized protein n=1 Tax=Ditylenchus dipsaci TaxID=166011 RepID=A0A915EJF8_9BILA